MTPRARRETSRRVAAAALLAAVGDGVAQKDGLPTSEPEARRYVEGRFWKPEYLPFVGS